MRFQQEARTIAMLNHENIIKVMDLNVGAEEFPYMVLELLSGTSLADLLEKDELNPERAIKIMIQASDALIHAHSHGVVHRDVKPSNFMLVESEGAERLKLVDFGIAKLLAPDAQAVALTQTGETIGSPLYMSPEQCAGNPLDERTDVYSLGCVMYEMITGSPPFLDESAFKVIMKHLTYQPESIMQVAPHVADAESLNAIVMKCLRKDPKDRYESVEAVKADLVKVRTGGKVRTFTRSALTASTLSYRSFGSFCRHFITMAFSDSASAT